MSNRKKIGLYILALLVVAYIMPVEKNWRPSYSKEHNWPYGAEVTRDVWSDLFADVEIREADLPIWNTLRDNEFEGKNLYVLFDGYMDFDSLNRSSLLNFVHQGNSVFISANSHDNQMLDTLGVYEEFYFDDDISKIINGQRVDTVESDFFVSKDSSYNFLIADYENYFNVLDSVESDIIALAHGNERSQLTFIKVKFGDGHFYIHNQPLLLTNYYVLQDEGKRYLERLTSFLPSQNVIWDSSHKAINAISRRSPLHVILNSKALKWAYWLSILGLVLLFLFRTKRRQRVIPVIEPPANDSVVFTKTMGSLYFNTATNKTLAEKKISILKEYLSSNFYVRDISFIEEEVKLITNKTELSKEEVHRLFKMINSITNSPSVSSSQLKVLNKGINRLMGKGRKN